MYSKDYILHILIIYLCDYMTYIKCESHMKIEKASSALTIQQLSSFRSHFRSINVLLCVFSPQALIYNEFLDAE